VTRLGLAALAAALVSTGVVSACASADAERAAPAADSIALRARIDHGAWQHQLSLKLVKTKLITFSLCAVWDAPAASEFKCAAPHGARLPAGTTMRLEQHPVGRALKRAESPGWGMLAASSTATVGAALSNTVTGDVTGTFRYRVTLRDSAGKVLLRSNVFPIDWHR
jgi:invasion protein IalB